MCQRMLERFFQAEDVVSRVVLALQGLLRMMRSSMRLAAAGVGHFAIASLSLSEPHCAETNLDPAEVFEQARKQTDERDGASKQAKGRKKTKPADDLRRLRR